MTREEFTAWMESQIKQNRQAPDNSDKNGLWKIGLVNAEYISAQCPYCGLDEQNHREPKCRRCGANLGTDLKREKELYRFWKDVDR